MWWKSKKNTDAPADAKPLIVMIDDEPDLCHIVGLTLAHEGYDFAEAYDGEGGLALIRARRPVLVILDLKMPKMNGYQMLAKLHQDPQLAATPVIVMTSITESAGTSDEEWAHKLGVCRFISKPSDATDILCAVHEQLRASPAPPPVPEAES